MLDYFDFVQASQRTDGNVPFAIFPAEAPPPSLDTFLRGMHYPEDIYTYKPRLRDGRPSHCDLSRRNWIGLFDHWQLEANPLSMLAPICYVLTAADIVSYTRSEAWLRAKLESVESAGRYVRLRKSANGFIDGSGFYVEMPPRNRWDGGHAMLQHPRLP